MFMLKKKENQKESIFHHGNYYRLLLENDPMIVQDHHFDNLEHFFYKGDRKKGTCRVRCTFVCEL